MVLQVASGQRPYLEIFGNDYPTRDGTCVRDYIHVSDLARAHVLALGLLAERSAIFNLGCGGGGYTVLEVVEAARKVTGHAIPVRFGPRRAGDPAVLVADGQKLRRMLGWTTRYSTLEAILQSAWDWKVAHPQGYAEPL